jgi:hypothetical protein
LLSTNILCFAFLCIALPQLHGISTASRSAYLKIFRDTIWEAALHGCGSRNKADAFSTPQQQQQQQQQCPAGLPAAVTYDAVLTIGSPAASQQVLFILRKAEEAKKARLPVVVQYLVSCYLNLNQEIMTVHDSSDGCWLLGAVEHEYKAVAW